jgi:hypothetical protein
MIGPVFHTLPNDDGANGEKFFASCPLQRNMRHGRDYSQKLQPDTDIDVLPKCDDVSLWANRRRMCYCHSP